MCKPCNEPSCEGAQDGASLRVGLSTSTSCRSRLASRPPMSPQGATLASRNPVVCGRDASSNVSEASVGDSGVSRRGASSSIVGASLLCVEPNAIQARSNSTRARLSWSSAPTSLTRADRPRRRVRQPGRASEPQPAHAAHGAGGVVKAAARSRKAAAAAKPPCTSTRAAECSSSPATSSSGTDAACARCHARRSGSSVGSVVCATR